MISKLYLKSTYRRSVRLFCKSNNTPSGLQASDYAEKPVVDQSKQVTSVFKKMREEQDLKVKVALESLPKSMLEEMSQEAESSKKSLEEIVEDYTKDPLEKVLDRYRSESGYMKAGFIPSNPVKHEILFGKEELVLSQQEKSIISNVRKERKLKFKKVLKERAQVQADK